MGSSISCSFNILLIGPSGVGKTYFLDRLQYNSDCSQIKTRGIYTADVRFDKFLYHFYEYDGTTFWKKMIYSGFNTIYFMVQNNYTTEQMLSAKNILIHFCEMNPNIPLVIIVIKKTNEPCNLNILQANSLKRIVATIQLDYSDSENLVEGLARLLLWTAAGGKDAQKIH